MSRLKCQNRTDALLFRKCNPAVIEDSLDRWLCAPAFLRVCPFMLPDAVKSVCAVQVNGVPLLNAISHRASDETEGTKQLWRLYERIRPGNVGG